MKIGDQSPWGAIESIYPVAEGIVGVSTASHGGWHLSKALYSQFPEFLKLNSYGGGWWFEEDCEIYLVVLAFPHLFNGPMWFSAVDTWIHFYLPKSKGLC